MEIALIAYVLYASGIMIWCSLQEGAVEHVAISVGLLEQWERTRSDMIVFELHPDGQLRRPPEHDDMLTATPSSLKGLMDWIPVGSTLVLCNCGLSSRAIQMIDQRLLLQNHSRVYWLDG